MPFNTSSKGVWTITMVPLSPVPPVPPVSPTMQMETRIELESRVTAPFSASRRPFTFAPVSAEMDVRAMTVPTSVEFVPSVAELPTCQKTMHACAPLIRITRLFDAVMSVDPV